MLDFYGLLKFLGSSGKLFFCKGLLVFGGDFHDPAKSDLNSNNNPPLRKMGREEQIEEREVLDSIFPEEITG